MRARHKGMMGAVAVALLGYLLHRKFSRASATSKTSRASGTSAVVDPPSSAAVPGVVPQVSPAALIDRVESSFRAIYLTQISIIQGVAFGFLARSALTDPGPTAEQWLAYGTAFMVIVIVWQEYMVGSTAFAWIPTLLDTVTPYVIGILEFLIIIRAREDSGSFLAMVAATECIGLVAYGNFWYHARHGRELNRNSYALIGSYVRFGLRFHLVSGPVAVLIWIGYLHFGRGLDLVFRLGTVLLFVPLFFHSIFNWSVPLYRMRRRAGLARRRNGLRFGRS